MNAFLLLIPLILTRYFLLGLLNKDSLKRAAHYPPMVGMEKTAFWFYQWSNIFLFLYLFFLKIRMESKWFFVGAVIYGIGVLLCMVSTFHFAMPTKDGFNEKGLYRISRNPMYVSYFIYFIGCFFLTKSYLLLALILIFQISSHWIVLSEERWCMKEYGAKYISYKENVRRYI